MIKVIAFLKKRYNQLVLHRWDLGFISNSMDSILSGEEPSIQHVKSQYRDRWFADPFILDYNDEEIILLVEDYSDSDKKGKISKLVIDRKSMKLKDVKIILELDTHLSFPAIIRYEGRVFIYPENSDAGGLWLYEYDIDKDECKKVSQLSDEPLTDAVLTERFGRKQIFSTKEPNPNESFLGIYDWDETCGNYILKQEVCFQEKIARNAGDFFEFEGNLYRPAQECNQMYGHAISIQKIEEKDGAFQMKDVRRILPPKGAFGIHTFNTYKGLIVVDLKVFRHPWIAVPLFMLRNLFKNAR